MRAQAGRYGASILAGEIGRLERRADGFTATMANGSRLRARHVLLATGGEDQPPQWTCRRWEKRSAVVSCATAPFAMRTKRATAG